LTRSGFNGLIQHSFALRMPEDRCLHGQSSPDDEVIEHFSLHAGIVDEFRVRPVGHQAKAKSTDDLAWHSPLVEELHTNTKPRQLRFLARDDDGYVDPLPPAFSWAGLEAAKKLANDAADEARFAFAHTSDGGEIFNNDFLVESCECERRTTLVSQALLEILAHKRSLLFGLALANRFVNVMLPHALLKLAHAGGSCHGADDGDASWILQPLVSLLRVGGGGSNFARMYSLTLFLIPVDGTCAARKMRKREIAQMVNVGWSLASSPWRDKEVPQFHVRGPLPDYIRRLSRFDIGRRPLTARQAAEKIAFGMAVTTAEDPTDCEAKRRIGDDVVTSLGSARVSMVVVVDPCLTRNKVKDPMTDQGPPGQLEGLMKPLARDTRVPNSPWSVPEQRKHRLDRPFVDQDTYVFGVVPQNRCLVVASALDAQSGRQESGLMQASSAAYMTIGAATAIGTMRAIDRDLERTRDSAPGEIARVDREIAGNLHEIYDLDITREAYRQLYRRLRQRLGITRDYETLQDKMQTLYRATSTQHEVKTQARLVWLTAWIVALSLLILIGTIIVAGKHGA
jgi:hypothetical protein